MLLDGVDGDDVRVVQRRSGTGLMQQPPGGVRGDRGEHFDGDGAHQHGVAGAIHRAHAALTEPGINGVVQQRRSDHRCRQ